MLADKFPFTVTIRLSQSLTGFGDVVTLVIQVWAQINKGAINKMVRKYTVWCLNIPYK